MNVKKAVYKKSITSICPLTLASNGGRGRSLSRRDILFPRTEIQKIYVMSRKEQPRVSCGYSLKLVFLLIFLPNFVALQDRSITQLEKVCHEYLAKCHTHIFGSEIYSY